MDDLKFRGRRAASATGIEAESSGLALDRRSLLRVAGVSLLASAMPGGPLGWLDSGIVHAFGGAPTARAVSAVDPLLVVIFLRGAADGLHLAPPMGDAAYARVRGSLALEDALSFAGPVGLHPKLAALSDVVAAGHLAVIHSVGSHHPTRSHFEAQDIMEAAESGSLRVMDGWMARAVSDANRETPFASVALTSALPHSLRGSGAFAIADPEDFGLPRVSLAARATLQALYEGGGEDLLHSAGRRAFAALDELEALRGGSTTRRKRRRRRSKPGGAGLLDAARHLGELDSAGVSVRAVALESSGWDTHTQQGTVEGRMARAIADLGDAMASILSNLAHRDPTIVVMTEFGRTVRPNGSGGTDHGHGGVMLVAGSGVAGGLYGGLPKLSDVELYEGRDLAVTTDYRDVLCEVVRHHLGGRLPAEAFPDFSPRPLGIFRPAV